MTIFDRIKQKASQAIQSVGNFIDRDKTSPGIQFFNRPQQTIQQQPFQQTNNGLLNRIGSDVSNVAGNLGRQIQQDTNRLIEQKPIPTAELFNTEQTPLTQGVDILNNIAKAPVNFGANMLNSYGRTLERLSTPEGRQSVTQGAGQLFTEKPSLDTLSNPAVETAFDVTDFVPAGALFAGTIKGVDNAVPFLKNADKVTDVVKPIVNNIDDVLSPVRGADNLVESGAKAVNNLDEVLATGKQVVPDGDVMLTQAAKDIANVDVNERGVIRKGYDYLMTQTPERLKRVFGNDFYGKHIDPIITNLNTASRGADDFIGQKLNTVGKVASDLGINAGTNDSKLIYTLRDNGFDAVASKVGKQRAEQIQALYDTMRASYDEVYDMASPIADELGKPLPKKENFLSQQGNKSLGFNIDLTSGKTITDEASASIFKKQGDLKNVDPLEAYSLYINKAANLIFMEPEAKRVGNLAESISKSSGATKDMLGELEGLRKSITGEGQEFSTARKLFDKYFGQVKGAAVIGKGSTLINQVLGIPGAIGNTGVRNFIEGNLDPATRKIVKEKSALFSSVNSDIPKSLQGSKIHQRILQGMADALQSANKFGYETSLRGFVKQAEKSGLDPNNIDEIVATADKAASRVLGDRREWMQPKFYDTFFGKLVAPFTAEQTAQAASFLQNLGDKKAATVIKTLIGWKVGNEIWQEVGGFSPFFDPAQMAVDTAELMTGSDQKEKNNLKAFMRVVEEGLSLLPPIQSMVNQAYSIGETAGVLPDSGDVFANDRTWMSTGSLLNPLSNIKVDLNGEEGEKWLPRNITGNKTVDTALNIGSKYIPGVEQIARTTQAANTINRGYAESRKGNPLFEAPSTIPEQAKALVFGQNSTKNAQDMFNSDFDWGLYGKQTDTIGQIPTRQGKIDFLRSSKEKNIADRKLDSVLNGTGGDIKQSDFEQGLFDGKKASSKSIKERMDVYKELNKIISDDTLPESYKQSAIKASGADPKDADYYSKASQDVDVKLQDVILPKLDSMSDTEVMDFLGSQRKVVGGKQMLTSGMLDYLYERDYISKRQRDALKALKYDEVKDEFYYKKSYSGGSKKLSYSQALKTFKIDLPKFSKLKSLDLLFEPIQNSTSQTISEGETLLSNILNG